MEDVEECFTKFFLQQAVEIEPATVQALIDHGFKSKVALLALDLVHDLPQITEVSLAQKAILRKYIGTLQQYSPFTLAIDEEALKKYEEPNKPSKKRKLELVEPESSDDDELEVEMNNKYQKIIQNYRNSTKVPALQVTSKAQSPGRLAHNGILLPESPVRPQRLSIKYHAMSEEDVDMPAEAEVDKISSQSFVSTAEPVKNVGKGRTSKKEVVRTKSQILFEQKKLVKSPPSATAIKEEAQSPQKSPSPQKPPPPSSLALSLANGRNNLPTFAPTRTPRSRRTTIGAIKQEVKVDQTSTPKAESKEPGHVPTPAELAIRAKIEAKKQTVKARGNRRASKI